MQIDQLLARLTPQALAAMQQTLLQPVVVTVQDNVQQRTPVRTGNLRRSIAGRVERVGERGVVGTTVSYAWAVQEGTRPHTIAPVNGKVLVFRVGNARVFARSVRHPGTRPQPFLDEGLAASRDTIDTLLAQAGDALWKAVAEG